MDAVQIENLSFKYKDQTSLIEALSLQIGKGERFGIFGPNGAGKTTLMSLITGLLPYQQGSIKISGKELTGHKDDVKKIIGLVPQDFSFYDDLSPEENMEFFGAWYGLDKETIRVKSRVLLRLM